MIALLLADPTFAAGDVYVRWCVTFNDAYEDGGSGDFWTGPPPYPGRGMFVEILDNTTGHRGSEPRRRRSAPTPHRRPRSGPANPRRHAAGARTEGGARSAWLRGPRSIGDGVGPPIGIGVIDDPHPGGGKGEAPMRVGKHASRE